ncbi:MAG: hypothetical protein JWM57_769, partial [Phycisphaerales bacterium]|nr:hypothetical protein [Phycisphaerales bacterium]
MALGNLGAALFASSAAVGLVLTPVGIVIARSVGLVDKPSVRKVHKKPVPRVGGVAIVLATILPLLVVAFFYSTKLGLTQFQPAATLLAGAVSLAVVGVLDDFFEIPSKYKLLAMLVASAAFCGAGGAVDSVVVRGVHLLDLGYAGWPVTMLWIALVTVSINFIDGLDGLAGGISLIACAVLAAGAAAGGDVQGVLIGLSLAGALSAFLVFNSYPARVFMGDCGSMFIGFTLAGTCALISPKVGTARAFLLPAMALSIPLLDTLFTMVRRGILQRRSLFAAERGHVHHRLLDTGLAHYHVVWILYLFTLAAAVVAGICILGGILTTLTAALAYFVGLGLLFRTAGSVRARDTLSAVRRNRALGREAKRYQSAFYDLELRFREAKDFTAWWETVCRAGEMLDFGKIDLPLIRRDGSETMMRWRRDAEVLADASSIIAEVPIPQRRSDVTLRATIEVLVTEFLESGGQRVALFSRLMGEFGLNQIKYKSTRSSPQDPSAVPEDLLPPVPAEPGPLPELRVAIVHDFLYTYAGAERVLEQMLQVFPQAGLFSLFDFLPEGERGFIGNRTVQTSFLQRLPMARRKHRAFLPLMPLAIEQLDVSQYDLVLSSSYVAAKGVITRPDQLHVCYCHTPVRFAWDLQNRYLDQVKLSRGFRSFAVKLILHYIRNWDVRSANCVDHFLTNSDFVGRRIKKVYRRESKTVYPPVDTDFFSFLEKKEDYYLTASRMVP